MFADFDEIFNEDINKNAPIPQVLLDSLNKTLKNGLYYIDDGKGHCSLKCDSTITISGVRLQVDNDIRSGIEGQVSGEITSQDVLEYAYNAQKTIKMICENPGYILMNGNEIKVEEMDFNPYKNLEFVEGEFICVPNKFPEPFAIKLSSKEYSVQVMINRIASDKLKIYKFESITDTPIYVHYSLDLLKQSMSFNIKLNLENESDVETIVKYMSVFNAFMHGEGVLCDSPFKTDVTDVNYEEFNEVTLQYWKKLLELEKLLDIKFDASKEEVSQEESENIEKIYQMLVKKNPIRDTTKLESLSCEWKLEDGRSEDELKDGVLVFKFESTMQYEIMGQCISLPAITTMYDVIAEKVVPDGERKKIIIDNNKKSAYVVSLAFTSIEERNKYMKTHDADTFHNAKTIYDYFK